LRGQEAGNLADGHREVNVANEAVLTFCREHALLNSPSLARFVDVQHGRAGIFYGEVARDMQGAVAAAVLGDNNFTGKRLRLDKGECCRKRFRQTMRLVVGREDDGEEGLFGCHESYYTLDVTEQMST